METAAPPVATAAPNPAESPTVPGGAADASLPQTAVDRPDRSAELVDPSKLPLQTKGRYIVDKWHYRVKWACINYAGAYFTSHVVGGLNKQPLASIARTISEMGFNCVRLPYSTQGWATNPIIDDSHVAANPQLQGGKHFREVFKATVDGLTDAGLMVIINNHNSKSGWCCTVDQDEGFWHVPEYNESQWIESLTGLAQMFKDNQLVVAFDVRNEPHDIRWKYLTWGDGNPDTDWAAAATRAGNAVLDVNPNLLIVVSALCFCMDLGPIKQYPIKLRFDNRVVYEVHNYIEFQLATLVTNNFMSWTAIQRLCWSVMVVLVSIVLLCTNVWLKLGKPLPPKGGRTMTFFAWYSFVCLLVLCLLAAMYSFYKLYCNYYARTFLVYMTTIAAGCLACGITGLAIGIFRWRRAVAILEELEEESVEGEDSDDKETFILRDHQLAQHGSTLSHGEIGESHWDSLHMAHAALLAKGGKPCTEGSVPWDRGLCCGLQLCCGSGLLTIVVAAICLYAHLADSYFYLQITFDHKWAFALDEGHPYTAPVWLGEFGQATRGRYWKHLMSYMATRDLDFAYWPLNGDKLSTGYFDKSGQWIDFDSPRWEDEAFGMLEGDYKTVRHPWKLLDLQAIMPSPAGWVPDSYPCDRRVLGNACGG